MALTKFVLITSVIVLIVACLGDVTNFILETSTDRNASLIGEAISISEIIEMSGYPVEVHENIQTEDGYLLTIHRIPHGKNKTSAKRPVVFVMHGMSASAEILVTEGSQSLAFFLADQGYDVWLGNARGTTHSMNHIRLDPKSTKFWDFSWHEIGYYDLPANINYILTTTNQTQLFYIGHSQGCTSFFAMVSTRPEMNKYIKFLIALAPGAYYGIENVALPETLASYLFQTMEFLRVNLGIKSFGITWSKELLCDASYATQRLCRNLFYVISVMAGINTKSITKDMVDDLIKNVPNTASAKQFYHYLQLYIIADFRQYDYGFQENRQKYGTRIPPAYNFSKITLPVALFNGELDTFVTVPNVERLKKALPNVISHEILPNFTHLDFLINKDAIKLLYNSLVHLMSNFDKPK